MASSPVFAQFGDTANYSLLPGGNFEGNVTGWSLNKASVVSGNETFNIGGLTDSNSLNIAGGSTTSAPFCVSSLTPTYRFFARSTSNSANGTLTVSVVYTGVNGNSSQAPTPIVLSTGNYASWQPVAPLDLGAPMNNGQTVNAQLVFSASPNSTWQIDDVYIDPYAR